MAMKRTKVEKWGGIEVSRLGFGCMRLPTNEDRTIDREKSLAMIDKAYKAGVNYFDTAYNYINGTSEIFTGDALRRYPRDSYYFATKLPVSRIIEEAQVDEIFTEQLKKTGLEYFDFYMLHGMNGMRIKPMRELGIYDKLIAKKEAGLIRRLGFSFHGDYEALCELVDNFKWDFVQIQINYLDYIMTDAKALYDKLTEKGIPVVVMEPVRGGYLANPPDSVKDEMKAFEGGKVTPAGWAMRWCISMENMPVILSGMNAMEQVDENLDTFSRDDAILTDAQRDFLGRCADMIMNAKAIPCTGCAYCMDCPSGVNIPLVFAKYNQYKLFHNSFRMFNDRQELIAKGAWADACVKCGVCVPLCPQGIDIPARLEEIEKETAGIQLPR
jgi:predicted aldo/keto reductase-like oxidoreductase